MNSSDSFEFANRFVVAYRNFAHDIRAGRFMLRPSYYSNTHREHSVSCRETRTLKIDSPEVVFVSFTNICGQHIGRDTSEYTLVFPNTSTAEIRLGI